VSWKIGGLNGQRQISDIGHEKGVAKMRRSHDIFHGWFAIVILFGDQWFGGWIGLIW